MRCLEVMFHFLLLKIKSMKKTIYIYRHGQTDLNKNHIVQGSGVDSSLNEKGRWQAQSFFNKYEKLGFDVILTSALKRTHETVGPFLEKNIAWEQFSEINEISWGIHEGKSSRPEMVNEYKTITNGWTSGNLDLRIPQGESAFELGERLTRFIKHLKARKEEKILVCSHGRAMRALICLMHDFPLTEMQAFSHHNTGLYIAHYQEGKFEFVLKNDISHLKNEN